jgi:phage terminase small subunit
MKRLSMSGAPVNRKLNRYTGASGTYKAREHFDEDGLSISQRVFTEHYLVSGNASASYKKCIEEGHFRHPDNGKDLNSEASRILRTPAVKEAIKRRQKHLQEKFEISQERVLREYACIAFSRLTDYYSITENDVVIRKPEDLTEEQKAAIADISIFENVVTGTRRVAKVKLHDKNDALKSLSKHLGLFEKDNKQRSTVNIQIDEILNGLPPEVSKEVRKQLVNDLNNSMFVETEKRTIN